jgi:hypothetical protein
LSDSETKVNTKVATLIGPAKGNWTGTAKHYRCDPPLEGHEFVVASATVAMYSGPETYIFPADAEGRVTGWGELEGSYRGGMDHDEALVNAGYEVRQ